MTIKIHGELSGDTSVGMFPSFFDIDTGVEELSIDDREYLRKTVLRDMWELHDNGTLRYWFSDEDEEDFKMINDTDSEKILKDIKNDK